MADTLIDTGLSGAAPNQESPAPPPAIHQMAHTAPAGWDTKRIYALMRDLAQEMFALPDILKKHSVSQAEYDAMCENEHFKRILAAMCAEWNTAANTPKRLALEALVALESRLPDVVARMSSKTEALSSVVQLAALLAKIGGLGEQAQANAPNERFKITINLGADVEQFEKERRPVITVETPAVQSLPQGESTGS